MYGTGCLSDLINTAIDVAFPTIPMILSVGSGAGIADYYIAHKIFCANVVLLTDVNPCNERSCHVRMR